MIKYLIRLVVVVIMASTWTACSDKLFEENHSNLTPDFFDSPAGFSAGLNAAYSGLRQFYGPEEGVQALTVPGTDEFRISNGSRPREVANYSSNYNSTNEFSQVVWNNAYTFINTCNGLVDFGSEMEDIGVDKKNQMIGEAKFLRAFYYFKLVQFFGDVSLIKNFSNSPTTEAVRNAKHEVYEFIIEDLESARMALVDGPQQNPEPGRASAAAAEHLLALVYLTRGYSSDAQSDDFQKAYDLSSGLISKADGIGVSLLTDFADVFKAKNENNKEVLFTVQYSTDKTFGGNHPLNHLFVTGYHVQLGERTVPYGRPFVWYTGTKWLYDVAFGDKVNDTRYEKTFQSLWLAVKDIEGEYTVKENGSEVLIPYKVQQGDTAMYMPGYEIPVAAYKDKGYFTYTPNHYTNLIYPSMTKFLDPDRATANENSYRPIIIYRLAETYLIAAEAAFKLGNSNQAADFINVIRRRAAAQGKAQAMEIDASAISLDFILDERTRELCGENMRWLDLVRTGKLIERVRKYDDGEAKNNIKEFHALRPIPQQQLERVITGAPYPQNAGW